ncbi:MAG: cysteine desulfurase family protein [Bryobacteraceae bacterium]
MQRFYFDHNATSPLLPEVLESLAASLAQVYGNASSVHSFGRDAKAQLERARRLVAERAGCDPREIVFTSGGTEADNLALLGAGRGAAHVITGSIEHTAVLSACAALEREGVRVTYVQPDGRGVVDPDAVRRALRPDTALVSVMHANNELGTLQPVEEIARIAREAGALFHCDGVQAFAKVPLNLTDSGIGLYAMSAHKIGGPKGIGALYVRKGARLSPVLFGGHHERDRRPGTENVPGAVGFGVAAQAFAGDCAGLRDRLERAVLERVPGAYINGAGAPRLPNTSNMRFDGADGEALVIALDLRGFAVSSGSACSSGALEPSHVLTAIGLKPEQARGSIRISLGPGNTAEQVDALAEAIAESVAHLRAISAGIR